VKKKESEAERKERLRAELRRDVDQRRRSYRGRALEIFPHVCGSCGREFAGKQLKELTVHHKDHDHTNNPPDGSNWELLCIYCHDHEHEKFHMKGRRAAESPVFDPSAAPLGNPFEGLDQILPAEEEEGKPRDG